MRYLVTLSDIHYIEKGLILFDSLINTSSVDFRLYYLCLDDETFNIINNINDSRLIAYHINNLYNEDSFKLLAQNNSSNPNDFSNFHFALGSYITHHLMLKFSLPELMYIDSDIKFYHDFEILFEVIQDKSIGLILHRHNKYGEPWGCYNVGIIYFKNNNIGFKCLEWWRNCLVDTSNPYYTECGYGGDQVYLEKFEILFGKENICIFDDYIGHGAPWNFLLYKYLDNNYINWNDKIQQMVFIHFSRFSCNDKEYIIDVRNSYKPWTSRYKNNPEVMKYYNDYFEHHKLIRTKYLNK